MVACALTPTAHAEPQPGRLVTVVGEAEQSPDESPLAALARAREEARRKAVERVGGVEVRDQLFRFLANGNAGARQFVQSLQTQLARGLVVAEREMSRRCAPVDEAGLRARCTVEIEAHVVESAAGPRDAGFRVAVATGREHYRDGDSVTVRATLSRDAHVCLIARDDDGRLALVEPVGGADAPLARAGVWEFPDVAARSRGVRLRVRLPAGVRETHEAVLVVALVRPLPRATGQPSLAESTVEGDADALRVLGVVAALDPAEWAFGTAAYVVHAR